MFSYLWCCYFSVVVFTWCIHIYMYKSGFQGVSFDFIVVLIVQFSLEFFAASNFVCT